MKVDYEILLSYLFKNLKFVFISTLLTTILGFIYLLNETPKYDVSTIISANNDEDNASLGSNGIVANLVGVGKKKALIYEFEKTIYSLDVAKRLDEQDDLLFKVFGDFYDEESKSYKEIINYLVILQKIKFWFYGIEYKAVPNHFMLRDYLQNSVSIQYDEFSELITVSSLTTNPYATEEMIRNLLRETDKLFKEIDKSNTDAKIDYLYLELSKSKEVNQIAAISGILQNELLKKSLIDSKADYKFRTVRGFEMSEYPVYPNFMFILALFAFFGFFGSTAYKLFRLVLNTTEE